MLNPWPDKGTTSRDQERLAMATSYENIIENTFNKHIYVKVLNALFSKFSWTNSRGWCTVFFQSNGLPLRLYNYKSWMQTKQKGMLQLENNFWLTSSTIIFSSTPYQNCCCNLGCKCSINHKTTFAANFSKTKFIIKQYSNFQWKTEW